MATALDLITDALIELGVIAIAQAPGPEDAALGLSRANNMLDTFNVDRRMIFSREELIFLLNANVPSPTIGASGTFVATRPVKVPHANTIDISATAISGAAATTGAGNKVLTDGAQDFTALGVVAGRDLVYVISGTGVTAGIYRIATVGTTTITLVTNPGSSGSAISYRVILNPVRTPIETHRDREWWAEVWNRGVAGIPCELQYEPAHPNGVLNLYPLQDIAVGLELFTDVQFTAFTLATVLSVPPGYYDVLLYELAKRLAPAFGQSGLLPTLKDQASEARAKVKSPNWRPPKLDTSVPSSDSTARVGFYSRDWKIYR